ncbi:MAG: flagellar M-ring protein FliF [Deltaproteobacteria bacterium]|jgi:flagellar M-ring protein FliF|nr:flagellar M-ring protein FliF [Deltaproteobacteria bacterium]
MPGFISTAVDKGKKFWTKITFSQRILVGGIAVVLVCAFFVMILALNSVEMAPLYSKLSAEDAGKIIKSLDSQKITYELELDANGTTIMAPADQIYKLRISIAGEGNISGQGIGFEAFDLINIGESDFSQHIKYQRALQGELARTISEFSAVDSVRVHLVLPKPSLFIEEQQKPSASVVIRFKDGRGLEPKEVNAVVNLVSMAVEGLTKDRIAVTDTAGKALFQPQEEGSLEGLTNSQYEFRLQTQRNLERRIEDLLTPVLGPGHVSVKVNADMDFSKKIIRKEMYDPQVAVVRSEQRMEESIQGRASLEGGVPDVNFRGDGLTGTVSNQQSSREQRTTNYEINKEEQTITSNVGEVNRLSIAVIVDGTYVPNAQGEMAFVPRTDDEIRAIRQLVASAAGFNSARGDTLEVSNIPFGLADTEEVRDLSAIITDYAIRIGKPFLNALLIFLFLLIVVRPVIMALIRPKVEGEMLEELAGLPMGEERLALVEGSDEELDAMAILEKIEDIKAHAMHLSEQNMEQAVGIIRSWLKGEQIAEAA